ncbi:MAG: hypothetical protein BWX70_03046 [Verrucomicrobia bacterium ADurb.Bin070]|nr:MAG: hypothetical protein BWX70_03046 [Verrucomicrobia bacterium ADurb.Bin070]
MLHHVSAMGLGLVAVAVAVRHGNTLQGEVEQPRAVFRFGHVLDQIGREIEVFLVLGPPVEPHHRLQDRRAGIAGPVAGLVQAPAALTVRAQLCDHIIAQPLAPLQDLRRLRRIVVVHQAHHRVLHAPDIPPLAAAQRVRVVADVSVLFLRSEHACDAPVDSGLQFRGAGVLQIRHGRVHVFAPELRLPPALGFRLFLKRRGDVVDIRSDHMAFDHRIEPLAERALEPHVADLAADRRPRLSGFLRGHDKGRQYHTCRDHHSFHFLMLLRSHNIVPFFFAVNVPSPKERTSWAVMGCFARAFWIKFYEKVLQQNCHAPECHPASTYPLAPFKLLRYVNTTLSGVGRRTRRMEGT